MMKPLMLVNPMQKYRAGCSENIATSYYILAVCIFYCGICICHTTEGIEQVVQTLF